MSASLASSPPGAALVASVLDGSTAHWGAEPRHPSLLHYGVAVLSTPHHEQKAILTAEAAHFYNTGKLPLRVGENKGADESASAASASAASAGAGAGEDVYPTPPDRPARPEHLQVVEPKAMPPARKGIENHVWNKLRLIHSLAHIESYAIDLSWDVLVRFARPSAATEFVQMPREFFEDWLRIASEEAKHYQIWARRLEELDSHYGAHPVHEALWSSALETKESILARLAVVHAVHEARGQCLSCVCRLSPLRDCKFYQLSLSRNRLGGGALTVYVRLFCPSVAASVSFLLLHCVLGLDQAPRMLQQLLTYGDRDSVKLLEVIEADELTHVSSGLRWFKFVCAHARSSPDAESKPLDPIPTFHSVVRANFRGSLLPPFNTQARTACGFTEEWSGLT
jgi:uncharacterized ferritin-like protein (DUF455 family)